MKVVAGVVLAIAAGFLIAALWSFLAQDLGWGPALASLGVAVLFIVIGIVMFVILLVLMFITVSYTNLGNRHTATEEHADPHRQHPNKHDHGQGH